MSKLLNSHEKYKIINRIYKTAYKLYYNQLSEIERNKAFKILDKLILTPNVFYGEILTLWKTKTPATMQMVLGVFIQLSLIEIDLYRAECR